MIDMLSLGADTNRCDNPTTIGLNTYSPKMELKEICHFFQNSAMSFEKYGLLKFSGVLIPIKYAVPIAISEYPEKSK